MEKINILKKQIYIILTFILFGNFIYSQEIIQPNEGKSIVYFTRISGVAPLIKFKLFDSNNFVGKISFGKYIVYECDPGYHIFIAKSENTDYVEANLEAGKSYIIETEGRMGMVVASVKLLPLDKNAKNFEKRRKRISKLLSDTKNMQVINNIIDNDDSENQDLDGENDDINNNEKEVIGEENQETKSRTIKRFYNKKKANHKITQLTSDMNFTEL